MTSTPRRSGGCGQRRRRRSRRAISAVSAHGLSNPSSGPGGAWVRYLIATSETPNSAPAAAPRSSPSARGGRWRRAEILMSAAPMAKIPPSTAISAASEACWRVVGAAAGQSDHHQPGRGDRHADPLPSSEVKAEEALREHGEEDEPAGEDRLHDRQRRERRARRRADPRPRPPRSSRPRTTWSGTDRRRCAADGGP